MAGSVRKQSWVKTTIFILSFFYLFFPSIGSSSTHEWTNDWVWDVVLMPEVTDVFFRPEIMLYVLVVFESFPELARAYLLSHWDHALKMALNILLFISYYFIQDWNFPPRTLLPSTSSQKFGQYLFSVPFVLYLFSKSLRSVTLYLRAAWNPWGEGRTKLSADNHTYRPTVYTALKPVMLHWF